MSEGMHRRLVLFGRAAVPVVAVIAIQLIWFPMPTGEWLRGAVLGLLGSLMAVGLGLVYRLNKTVNFAQGDLGTAPAVLAVGLIGISGVNYFVGLATGIVGAVLLAVIVEVLVIRRFVRASRLVLTVVTIGLSQTLVVISLIIPRIWGQTPISSAVASFPWHLSLRLSPVVLDSNDLVAAIVSMVCLVGVAVWFKRSDVGIAVRAAGDRRDRAAMLGIPVNRLQTITWVVAGLLSFASIFFQATIVGLPLDPTYSLTALVSALAALALGGFGDLPVVAASAIALGILEEGVSWNQPSNPTIVLAVVAGVVLVAVLIRELVAGRPAREAGSAWTLVGAARAMSPQLRARPEVRVGTPLGLAILATAVLTVPLWMGPGALIDMSTLIIFAIIGCSVVVLTGWAGQVSLAQMSFAAVGAVVGAVALIDWHFDLSLALLLAGAAAAVVAVVVGIPTLRLEGIFVAVTTLAFGLATSGYLLVRAEFSWIPQGYVGTVRLFGVTLGSESSVFEVCAVIGMLVVAGLHGLRQSRAGRVLRALPDNERAASSYGVHDARAKLGAFGVAGFVAGVAGCLFVVVTQQYNEDSFQITVSLAVFTATAVGGLASPLGAVLGAAVVEGSSIFLPPSFQLFPSAIGVVIVLLAFPGGLSSLWFSLRDHLMDRVAARHPGTFLKGGASGPTHLGTGAGSTPTRAPAVARTPTGR
jgi:branched-chain amino acid transport system permease protein